MCFWYHNGVASLTIKNVPDSLREELKREAEEQGRSLNAHVIQILELSAREQARRKRMRLGAEELERFVASLPSTGDSAALIREDRDRR